MNSRFHFLVRDVLRLWANLCQSTDPHVISPQKQKVQFPIETATETGFQR